MGQRDGGDHSYLARMLMEIVLVNFITLYVPKPMKPYVYLQPAVGAMLTPLSVLMRMKFLAAYSPLIAGERLKSITPSITAGD